MGLAEGRWFPVFEKTTKVVSVRFFRRKLKKSIITPIFLSVSPINCEKVQAFLLQLSLLKAVFTSFTS